MLSYIYNLATDKHKGLFAGLIKVFLFIFSLIYGSIIIILSFLYRLRPYHLNCKIISVGNITLGGTGKTSLVEYIARYLREKGHKVAILSRGYKKKSKVKSQDSKVSYETIGDESYMLQMKLKDMPVVVDPDRIRGAKKAMRDYGVDTVILDDGFQQWKIAKDLEIVTVDVTNPFGNRYLIPRGILRQPLASLKYADIFILTKTNLGPNYRDIKDSLSRINPKGQVFVSIHRPLYFYNINKSNELLRPDVLKGKTVTLFSGIGDPDSFENLIISLGIKVGFSFRFRDHHPYSKKDLEDIVETSQKQNIDTIITTEKDAVRLKPQLTPRLPLPIFVLGIELKITKDEQGFYSRLLGLYSI